MWLGATIHSGDREFRIPTGSITRSPSKRVDKDGNTFLRVPGVRWFTNVDHGRRHQPINLMTEADNIKFSKHAGVRDTGYQKYENYDAIEVPRTEAIPSDYEGVMGVPISFLSKYNPDQFTLLGMSGNGEVPPELIIPGQAKYDRPYLGGTRMYVRLFLQHKRSSK
jgi:hypothetical protein